MLFDEMIRVAERHIPDLQVPCRKARVFRFDPTPSTNVDEDQIETRLMQWDDDTRLLENLKLPFDAVVFEEAPERESRGSLSVMLWTEPIREGQDPRTLHFAVLATKLSGDHMLGRGTIIPFPSGRVGSTDACREGTESWVDLVDYQAWGVFKKGIRPLNLGTTGEIRQTRLNLLTSTARVPWEPPAETENMRQRIARVTSGVRTARQEFETREDLDRALAVLDAERAQAEKSLAETHLHVLQTYLVWAMMTLVYVNTPSMFIVEESPMHQVAPQSPGTIKRTPGRSHYIVLAPAEIRRRYLQTSAPSFEADPDLPGHKRAAHERRGHWRTYRSEKYKHMRNQRVWIEAMWIGPREGIVGPNKYVVRLDI